MRCARETKLIERKKQSKKEGGATKQMNRILFYYHFYFILFLDPTIFCKMMTIHLIFSNSIIYNIKEIQCNIYDISTIVI